MIYYFFFSHLVLECLWSLVPVYLSVGLLFLLYPLLYIWMCLFPSTCVCLWVIDLTTVTLVLILFASFILITSERCGASQFLWDLYVLMCIRVRISTWRTVSLLMLQQSLERRCLLWQQPLTHVDTHTQTQTPNLSLFLLVEYYLFFVSIHSFITFFFNRCHKWLSTLCFK